ncbi:unnamed protein product [Schistosoma rodhaini]|uniref:Glutamyl-tRNA(Gln) amidotransferase subunit C, mitochondrial n=1 Tax=Schistosoma rodhaini TaxID=6188 RepID=A0AA85FBF6_9TREM|nr:unnamed protein product [Schistosoma rodhaini]
MILKHCTRINQTLSLCCYYQCTKYIGKNQIRDFSTESLKNVLSDTVINKNCTDEEIKCLGKSSVYRFVPSKPIWKRFDVGVQHELDVNDISETKDCASPDNQDIFCIDHSALPKRTHLDMNVVKLLEQVSLINFKEENLRILEEAIRYADSLLTKEAFHGTTNNQCWSIDNTEPMISLCDEINVGFNWFLDDDNRDNHIVYNCNLATDIMQQVPDKWEGYIVAPLGNIPVEQNESSQVQGVTV